MVWAHRAEAAANDLDSGHTALRRAFTHPTVSQRGDLARGAERAIKRAEEIRSNAIDVANMWAAVAAAQPITAEQPRGQCPIFLRTGLVGHRFTTCQFPDGHSGVHSSRPDSAGNQSVWITEAPDAFDVTTQLFEEAAAPGGDLSACDRVTNGVCMFNREVCSPTCHLDDSTPAEQEDGSALSLGDYRIDSGTLTELVCQTCDVSVTSCLGWRLPAIIAAAIQHHNECHADTGSDD